LKLTHLLALAAGLALASGQAANAYDIKFTGKTRATGKLMQDVLGTITGYSKYTYKCSFIFAVDSTILPPNYVPRAPAYRMASPQRSYERWALNLCGQRRWFFVAFGNTPQGGADYKVQEIKNGVLP
jgi:hypothetical protein